MSNLTPTTSVGVEQHRALHRQVSVLESLQDIQLVKKGKQLVSILIPPPIEDIVPFVDWTHIEQENSDADDEGVIQDEDFERFRVAQPLARIRKGSRPQIRDDPRAAGTLPHLVMTLVSDTERD